MTRILITGANGFIGSALGKKLSSNNQVVGTYLKGDAFNDEKIDWEQLDLADLNSAAAVCEKYSPDVVIHCAGIAHQKMGAVDSATYRRVNSEATEELAKAAANCNPQVQFIFLSSVSVYGESNPNRPVKEDDAFQPSSDYATSKLDAEKRLISLVNKGVINNLTILRLAPVYDRDWSFNLDRRILAPKKIAYLRFGSGSQKMSALARPNLVDFIDYLLKKDKKQKLQIFNVCDAESYEFNKIIQIFKKSGIRPNKPVIYVPLFLVWLAIRLGAILFFNKRKWFYSCYDKLASSLVFSSERMKSTGFRQEHSLETVFSSQI